MKTIEERFWSKVDKGGECWLWTAARDRHGYGKFAVSTRTPRPAHRVSWFFANGKWPQEGMTIDHLCRNRRCVRVAHLEVVTLRENILRGESTSARNARKTECLRGHSFTPDNTVIRQETRQCRICERLRHKQYYWADREKYTRKAREYRKRVRERN